MIPLSLGCELPTLSSPPNCIFHCPQLSQLLPAWTTLREASTPLQPISPVPMSQRVNSHGSLACAPAPQPGFAPGELTSPWDLAESMPRVGTVHSEKPEEAGKTRRVQQRGWGGTTPPWVWK